MAMTSPVRQARGSKLLIAPHPPLDGALPDAELGGFRPVASHERQGRVVLGARLVRRGRRWAPGGVASQHLTDVAQPPADLGSLLLGEVGQRSARGLVQDVLGDDREGRRMSQQGSHLDLHLPTTGRAKKD